MLLPQDCFGVLVVLVGRLLLLLCSFGLAFGETPPYSNGVIGDPSHLGGLMFGVGAAPLTDLAATIPMTVFFMFQLMFAVITPALIIGAIADRWAIHLCKSDTVDVPWVRPCLSTL